MSEIKQRDEIANEFKWNTADIFKDDATWEAEYISIRKATPQLEELRGKLTTSDTLLACLQLCDNLGSRFGLLSLYAMLKFSENTADSTYTAMSSRVDSLAAELGAAVSFIIPEILSLDESTVLAWTKDDTDLTVYRHHLHNIYRQKAHVLSPELEEMLAFASEVTDAPATIFSMIDDADMRFGTVTDTDGNLIELTHGRYFALMQSPNRDVRREAFLTHHKAYMDKKNTLAANLNAWLKRNIFYAKTRGYESALHSALSENNIPTDVYTNLLDTISANSRLIQRYLGIRKEFLRLDELHVYDLLTPIVLNSDTKISWEDAKSTLLKALAPLGESYVAIVARAFEERWIDVYENEGKTSGAYCAGVYGTHPYILMNFNNTLEDLFTLAHEVGHMMHSYYTNAHQPYVYSNYTIFVAEVASTVNEALLTDYLLQTTTDKTMQAYLVNQALDGYIGTLFRQTMLAKFELLAHEMVTNGEPLTPESACALYRKLNTEQYGDSVVLNPESDYGWARIPHFYMNFYVFQYATGKSAAAALAQGIIARDTTKTQAYLDFLASGCADYSIDLLKTAGVDMSTPQPIEAAMSEFEALLDKLEVAKRG